MSAFLDGVLAVARAAGVFLLACLFVVFIVTGIGIMFGFITAGSSIGRGWLS